SFGMIGRSNFLMPWVSVILSVSWVSKTRLAAVASGRSTEEVLVLLASRSRTLQETNIWKVCAASLGLNLCATASINALIGLMLKRFIVRIALRIESGYAFHISWS